MDIQALLEQYTPIAVDFGLKIIAAIAVFIIGRWLTSLAVKLLNASLEHRGVDTTVRQFLANVCRSLGLALVLVVVLSQLGVETASLIAVLGAAGLAVGLALQGSLSNFASGVLLIVLKPCKVGDYVDAGGTSGTIDKIDILATTMTTPDNKSIVVPNSCIMSGPITNYSAHATRRVDLVIGVSYDADLNQTQRIISDVLSSDSRILANPSFTVAVAELADSSVNFVVRPWVKKEDYWDVFFDLQKQLKETLDANNIVIPFPQMDIHTQAAS